MADPRPAWQWRVLCGQSDSPNLWVLDCLCSDVSIPFLQSPPPSPSVTPPPLSRGRNYVAFATTFFFPRLRGKWPQSGRRGPAADQHALTFRLSYAAKGICECDRFYVGKTQKLLVDLKKGRSIFARPDCRPVNRALSTEPIPDDLIIRGFHGRRRSIQATSFASSSDLALYRHAGRVHYPSRNRRRALWRPVIDGAVGDWPCA